jgi:4-amino-4-deoxy-L-arabinose transferase-like glycosyltransferase
MAEAAIRRPRWERPRAIALPSPRLTHPVWPALVLGLVAGYMRLHGLSGSAPNPFYDAAVRSMAESWRNFFYGAFDPAGQLAVDKPPVDLWLQVASVKLFGWSTRSLILPAAIFGTLAVPLLYDAVRRVFGMLAGVCAGVALLVLPISVVSARSDALDSVMMALLVLALWLCVRAVQTGRARWLYLTAGVMGIAFNVKLFEAVVPLPALFLIYLLGSPVPLWRRVAQLCAGLGVFVVASLAWIVAVSLSPGKHPYPIGSTNGSVWNVVFVFNGYNRLLLHRRVPANGLFSPDLAGRIGPELVAAFILGGLAVIAALRLRGLRRPVPVTVATAAGIALWLITGTILFQRMQGLRARYLEAFTPAVAAALGIGVALLATRAARGRLSAAIALAAGLLATPLVVNALASNHHFTKPPAVGIGAGVAAAVLALGLVAATHVLPSSKRAAPAVAVLLASLALVSLLAASTSYSRRLIVSHTTDSGRANQLSPRVLDALDGFLRSHRGGTKYEYGTSDPSRAAGLIIRDGQPGVILTTYHGHMVMSLAHLRSLVVSGQVRWFITKRPCAPAFLAGCVPTLNWVTTHGVRVSARYGLPKTLGLYELTRAGALSPPHR